RSGHNRLSKIELILVDWDVPKSFTRSKTHLFAYRAKKSILKARAIMISFRIKRVKAVEDRGYRR
ncbi:MAG: hypothetical protein KZQ60_19720, partial [Candidatus Thiodiazotropha sp. (ex Lucinoma aequizonata)]|nr:hypothetical protein [Candidatus Thiodiazotropha sp. (ex Lucinoma aequizonata)]MCU7912543.1 hypothetical protein [Candidatus Thiodiazotropha sp. (ex Lucinoma aequizonata)]